jgi:hypothetical protein
MFVAYLGYRFDAGKAIEQSLIGRWARNVTDWGGGNVGMDRTFCGLAGLLDDDYEFGLLGYAPPGEYEAIVSTGGTG